MSGLEVNKILASIFVALIVVGLISILGDAIINGKNNEQAENAYYIDISEIETSNIVTNIQNKDISEEIKIGMTADLEFRVEGNEEKILVPTVSIVTEKGEKGMLKVEFERLRDEMRNDLQQDKENNEKE